MYQMIYQISINVYRYEYRIEKTDRCPALLDTKLSLHNLDEILSKICTDTRKYTCSGVTVFTGTTRNTETN